MLAPMRLCSLVGSGLLVACGSKAAPPPAVVSSTADYPSGPAATVPCPTLERLSTLFAPVFPETPARATECYELYRGAALWFVVGSRDSDAGEVGGAWTSSVVFAADDQSVLAKERGDAWIGAESITYAIADVDGDGSDEILVDREETSRHGVERALFVQGVANGAYTDLGNAYLGGRDRYSGDEEPPLCTGRWTIEPSAKTPGPKRIVVMREGAGCEQPGTFTFALTDGRLTPQ